VTLTRNQLFKLSPKTRARAVKLRAAVRTSPPKKAVNATARVKGGLPIQKINRTKLKSIPKNVLKDRRFTNMWLKIKDGLVPYDGETVYNVETRARDRARSLIRNRLNKGLQPFSASPPAKKKTPSPASVGRPHGLVKLATLEHVRSPKSGRFKIRAPNSGRLVYADGASVSLAHLKNLAQMVKANIKGLRSKAQIANKIFSNKK
jgi:hypothetical protein